MEGGGDDLLSSMDWTDEDTVALAESVVLDGSFAQPIGFNKHFNMIVLLKRFHNATKKHVDAKVLWDKLQYHYDTSNLDKNATCPFPNETSEFSLPEGDFSQLIRDRKNQSSSQDKLLDDDSRDSGSGRETPPNLPIAKRGATLQSVMNSSTKRKYSASSSDVGSDSGRKSTSSTPSGNASMKAKRRI